MAPAPADLIQKQNALERLHLRSEQHAGELIAESEAAGLPAKAGHEKIGSDQQPTSDAPTGIDKKLPSP
jgi:hypothetical protein